MPKTARARKKQLAETIKKATKRPYTRRVKTAASDPTAQLSVITAITGLTSVGEQQRIDLIKKIVV